MKEAMRLFGEANAKHPAVKKLTPGLATRSVLARHAAKKAGADAETRRAVRAAAFVVG
jgi:hypothetical protein